MGLKDKILKEKQKISIFRHNRRLFFIVAILGILMLLAIEGTIDVYRNIVNADATIKLLLKEIQNVFISNEEEESVLMSSLKDDYITRARAVAYVVQRDPELETNQEELALFASLMNVDEIHFFNEEGILYAGTNPEYYGLSVNDGEQVRFFAPMLKNKNSYMCQDMTPNTAVGKSMMYAMVWRQDGTGMVQVGIEPERLLHELNIHDASEVASSMPMVDGISVYIADADTGLIYGATEKSNIGKKLEDLEIYKDNVTWGQAVSRKVNGHWYRICFAKYDDYAVGVLYDMKEVNKGFVRNLLIVFAYLLILSAVIYAILRGVGRRMRKARKEIEASKEERDKQLEILLSMSQMYTSMHLIDLKNHTVTQYESTDQINSLIYETDDLAALMKRVMTGRSSEESREKILKFTDLNTVAERMKDTKSIYRDFINVDGKWSRAVFITIKKDEEGYPTALIYAVQLIDEEKRREQELYISSNTDELTGCHNRRAYEHKIASYDTKGIPEDLVLLSMDVNGLKAVNDSKGHAAGDELILGAVECMREAFGKYGKIYRTGGDEFMALLHVKEENQGNSEETDPVKLHSDETTAGEIEKGIKAEENNFKERKTKELVDNFQVIVAEWSGSVVKELAVSCGYVCYDAGFIEKKGNDTDRNEWTKSAMEKMISEHPVTMQEMEKLADKRMYQEKSSYYRSRGVDRRGQTAAYRAVLGSYTKILKVDLTEDSYQIVKMEEMEKTTQKGFTTTISGWLYQFGASGQVQKEDLPMYQEHTELEYLRQLFRSGRKHYSISYRRRIGEEYRKVMMEMVPADDYSEEKQLVYLYVKDIDA